MASRDKKQAVGKRQTGSPVPPPGSKDGSSDSPTNSDNPKITASAIAKKLSKTAAKKAIKKTLAIQMKAKAPPKLSKKLTKALLSSVKPKRALLKNGVRVKRAKDAGAEIVVEGVLEAVEGETEVETKKVKKRPAKKQLSDGSSIDETIESIVKQVAADDVKPPKKARALKKPRTTPVQDEIAPESIEDVMNDLSCLISNTKNSPEPKSKKYSKKQLEMLKRRLIKKENIENDLNDSKVIDMLDLNVHKLKRAKPLSNRRHSIEKFPVGSLDNTDVPTIAQLKLFSNLPRSSSPKSKRPSIRQSIDGLIRRTSPYATRSDSPARILRNGKHRRLKDLNLLDGLDLVQKKRKRIGSDYSGSELSVSKSGYDSDSSFPDLGSLEAIEVKKEEVTAVNHVDEPTVVSTVKRSASVDAAADSPVKELRDSNSNLFDDVKPSVYVDGEEACFENLSANPSLKVPDKSIILNIMKQTFNDIVNEEQEKEKRATRSSTKKIAKPDEPTGSSQFCVEDELQVAETQKEAILELEPPKPDVPATEVTENNTAASVEDVLEPEPTEETPQEIVQPTEDVQVAVEEVPELNGQSDVNKPTIEEETPENLAIKENILQALGLQSWKAAEEAKVKEKEKTVPKTDVGYTGTLKTVIKLNRCEKKKGRNSLKMTLQKSRASKGGSDSDLAKSEDDGGYKIMKDKEVASSSSWKSHGNHSSDTAGAHRKSHYSNRSNMDGSSEHTSDGDTSELPADGGSAKVLVIPEKASSFSIHPGRLCKDECSYCFGKFGLFDTPCHIAQMKSVERQNKILSVEKHLTRDSCLCDACYRHVDRKNNTPSYTNKSSFKRSNLVAPGPRQNHCHVLGCEKVASNILRRKWIIKMRKSICQEINIDLANHGLHSIPICDEHYAKLEHLMVCAMCKRRLASNHMHNLGPESRDLNESLNAQGIPVTLPDRPVVCKFCRYFATLLLRDPDDRPENTSNFFKGYKKRLLHFHHVELMDEAEAEEPIPVPAKEKHEPPKKKKKSKSQSDGEQPPVLEPQVEIAQSRVSSESRSESPSDYMVDYNTLIPNIAMECGSDVEMVTKRGTECVQRQPLVLKKLTRPESIREAVEISKNLRRVPMKSKSSDLAVQRLGSNPALSVRQLFPGEEEMALQGQIEFSNVKERTPEGWEKCTATIQYDSETKNLWHDLQKPYGNQSSFLRHLILLEKYFRNGDLVLSPNASPNSVNYSESVRNRLKAFDNLPACLSVGVSSKAQRSNSGIITSKEPQIQQNYILNAANIPKNTPITISQLNSSNFMTNGPQKPPKASPGMPPGLISLHPGTARPIAPPLMKVPQSQKIKFPITKNWRPNLIPIDPNKKPEKKPGLVQVISSGKPYHITIEDYKKMCAIKKSFEMKQKKSQEVQKNLPGTSVLKGIAPKKGLVVTKSPETNPSSLPLVPSEQLDLEENSLEKLEAKFSDRTMILPKIPKSLTVIPQTVAKRPSRPSSPVLMKSRTGVKS